MHFNKTCQTILILVHKNFKIPSKSLSRHIYVRAPFKTNKKNLYSNFALAAAASALGFSLYVAYKRKTFCEAVHTLIDKELNKKVCVPRTNVGEIIQNRPIDTYDDEICKSRDLLQRLKDEVGAPGIVVGVSINGKTVWIEGLGYADIENRVSCSANTVMRIASISKSITMAAVAKLWEQGKLDLDKPVQDYVPYFPTKTFEGKPVTITCRQLVSHLGGIRHYEKNGTNTKKSDAKSSEDKSKKNSKSEFEYKEYYIKDHYKDVKSAVDLFKDDPLIANPGSKYFYTTHGWTLISAIVEAASKEQFPVHITKLFKSLGMNSTYLDVNDVLIYHRSRNYVKDKNGHLINAPYVDNSYKWAGGGFLSTVEDLIQFANAMLYSLQYKPNIPKNVNNNLGAMNDIKDIETISDDITVKEKKYISHKQNLPGFLNSKTVEAMWMSVTDTKEGKYGMGWAMYPEVNECQFCENKKFCVYHTGGAIGASSVLLILPQKSNNKLNEHNQNFAPKGIIVTILMNLQSIQLSKTALKIAEIFDKKSLK